MELIFLKRFRKHSPCLPLVVKTNSTASKLTPLAETTLLCWAGQDFYEWYIKVHSSALSILANVTYSSMLWIFFFVLFWNEAYMINHFHRDKCILALEVALKGFAFIV